MIQPIGRVDTVASESEFSCGLISMLSLDVQKGLDSVSECTAIKSCFDPLNIAQIFAGAECLLCCRKHDENFQLEITTAINELVVIACHMFDSSQIQSSQILRALILDSNKQFLPPCIFTDASVSAYVDTHVYFLWSAIANGLRLVPSYSMKEDHSVYTVEQDQQRLPSPMSSRSPWFTTLLPLLIRGASQTRDQTSKPLVLWDLFSRLSIPSQQNDNNVPLEAEKTRTIVRNKPVLPTKRTSLRQAPIRNAASSIMNRTRISKTSSSAIHVAPPLRRSRRRLTGAQTVWSSSAVVGRNSPPSAVTTGTTKQNATTRKTVGIWKPAILLRRRSTRAATNAAAPSKISNNTGSKTDTINQTKTSMSPSANTARPAVVSRGENLEASRSTRTTATVNHSAVRRFVHDIANSSGERFKKKQVSRNEKEVGVIAITSSLTKTNAKDGNRNNKGGSNKRHINKAAAIPLLGLPPISSASPTPRGKQERAEKNKSNIIREDDVTTAIVPAGRERQSARSIAPSTFKRPRLTIERGNKRSGAATHADRRMTDGEQLPSNTAPKDRIAAATAIPAIGTPKQRVPALSILALPDERHGTGPQAKQLSTTLTPTRHSVSQGKKGANTGNAGSGEGIVTRRRATLAAAAVAVTPQTKNSLISSVMTTALSATSLPKVTCVPSEIEKDEEITGRPPPTELSLPSPMTERAQLQKLSVARLYGKARPEETSDEPSSPHRMATRRVYTSASRAPESEEVVIIAAAKIKGTRSKKNALKKGKKSK